MSLYPHPLAQIGDALGQPAEIITAAQLRRGDVIEVGLEQVHVMSVTHNRATGRVQIVGGLSDQPDDAVGLTWPSHSEFRVSALGWER